MTEALVVTIEVATILLTIWAFNHFLGLGWAVAFGLLFIICMSSAMKDKESK